jgi:DNA-binding NarL/FixJ family response regulator
MGLLTSTESGAGLFAGVVGSTVSRHRLGASRFLVVEDDAMASASLRRVLQQQGARVEEAVSIHNALEQLQERGPFHVAFVDHSLLHEPARLLRPLRRSACCPVVISGAERPGIEREAIGEGAYTFLRKPFSVERFVEVSAEALEMSRRWRGQFIGQQPQRAERFELLDASIVAERLGAWPDLSHREREVLARVVLGWSNEEVADDLRVSVSTVKYHDLRGRTRLGVSSRRQLTRLVLEGSHSLDEGQDDD